MNIAERTNTSNKESNFSLAVEAREGFFLIYFWRYEKYSLPLQYENEKPIHE